MAATIRLPAVIFCSAVQDFEAGAGGQEICLGQVGADGGSEAGCVGGSGVGGCAIVGPSGAKHLQGRRVNAAVNRCATQRQHRVFPGISTDQSKIHYTSRGSFLSSGKEVVSSTQGFCARPSRC